MSTATKTTRDWCLVFTAYAALDALWAMLTSLAPGAQPCCTNPWFTTAPAAFAATTAGKLHNFPTLYMAQFFIALFVAVTGNRGGARVYARASIAAYAVQVVAMVYVRDVLAIDVRYGAACYACRAALALAAIAKTPAPPLAAGPYYKKAGGGRAVAPSLLYAALAVLAVSFAAQAGTVFSYRQMVEAMFDSGAHAKLLTSKAHAVSLTAVALGFAISYVSLRLLLHARAARDNYLAALVVMVSFMLESLVMVLLPTTALFKGVGMQTPPLAALAIVFGLMAGLMENHGTDLVAGVRALPAMLRGGKASDDDDDDDDDSGDSGDDDDDDDDDDVSDSDPDKQVPLVRRGRRSGARSTPTRSKSPGRGRR